MKKDFNEIISMLKELGLTEYESKTYFFLVVHKSLSADELCGFTGISSSRIYDVLSSLERKGLVSTLPGKPKLYSSTSPSVGLNVLIGMREDKMKEDISSMKKTVKNISEMLMNVYSVSELPEKTFSLGVIRGLEGLNRLTRGFLRSSKKETLIFAGDLTWLEANIEYLKLMKKKGIDVKILADILSTNKEFVNKVKNFGVEVKQKSKDLDIRGFVVDDNILYVSKKFTVKGWKTLKNFGLKKTMFREDYSGLVTRHKPLVKAVREYFFQIWNST